jgi:hypothetical protein
MGWNEFRFTQGNKHDAQSSNRNRLKFYHAR